jgi:tight adherence protein B
LALAAGIASQRWWGAALAFAAGSAIPSAYVWARRRARVCRMTTQFPDALDAISRAVRAGQTVPAAFQMVADDFPMPISDEFRYCYEQQNFGLSYDAALRNLAQRTGIMELRILVVALLVQSRSGGNLSELLQNLSTTVRKRLVLQQKVKALTGEGRMQAAVLIALPVVVFIAMYFLNRDYAQILLDRPWLLAGCVASQTVGAAVIHKFIQIDY